MRTSKPKTPPAAPPTPPGSPHCKPDPNDEWDDKVCSCAPEPYMVEWLEREEAENAEKQDRKATPDGNNQGDEQKR